jgi:hypothetical protein
MLSEKKQLYIFKVRSEKGNTKPCSFSHVAQQIPLAGSTIAPSFLAAITLRRCRRGRISN